MKVKADPIDEIGNALGDAPETEFTFLLMPVATYSVLSQFAREEGCSVGEVLQKAVLQYLQSASRSGHESVDRSEARPEPDMVMRRNKGR